MLSRHWCKGLIESSLIAHAFRPLFPWYWLWLIHRMKKLCFVQSIYLFGELVSYQSVSQRWNLTLISIIFICLHEYNIFLLTDTLPHFFLWKMAEISLNWLWTTKFVIYCNGTFIRLQNVMACHFFQSKTSNIYQGHCSCPTSPVSRR